MNISMPPLEIGYWSLYLGNENQYYISTWYKPSKWQRFWMKFLLGFIWKEIKGARR